MTPWAFFPSVSWGALFSWPSEQLLKFDTLCSGCPFPGHTLAPVVTSQLRGVIGPVQRPRGLLVSLDTPQAAASLNGQLRTRGGVRVEHFSFLKENAAKNNV